MKARIVEAGMKYFAISFSSLAASALFERTEIFRLMMPSRHLCPASNTPEPEFPVVATSLITVGNLFRTFCGSNVVCASSGLFTQFDTVTSGFRNYRGLWPACAGRQGMLPGHTANLLEGLRSAAAPSGAGPRRSKQAARLVQQQLRRAPQSFASR
jgi:hypothetical protein